MGLAAIITAKAGDKELLPEPLPDFKGPSRDANQAHARKSFLLRVRPDADWAADGYSRSTYLVTDRPDNGTWTYSASGWPAGVDAGKRWGILIDTLGKAGSPIDEYGRPWHGVSGNPFSVMLKAAGITLPFIPGIGPTASAAIAAAIALGEGKSLEDAALAAARNAMPGGALGRMAFDFGVGLVNGAPVDEAADKAFMSYLAEENPDAIPAYNAGKKLGKVVA